jgi:hypothetical protein
MASCAPMPEGGPVGTLSGVNAFGGGEHRHLGQRLQLRRGCSRGRRGSEVGYALVAILATTNVAACGAARSVDSAGASAPISSLAVSPTAGQSSSPGYGATASGGREFTLDEGVEHDVCGIGIVLKFIPPSESAGAADEAVLVGGPLSGVPGVLGGQTGDVPLPGTVAPARAGLTVTVFGKRFSVLVVDAAHTRVRLKALC